MRFVARKLCGMPDKAKTQTRAEADSSRVASARKLPHERDETPDSGAPARGVIRQAESDVREGQVDTDNYTRIRETARRAPAAGRDRRR